MLYRRSINRFIFISLSLMGLSVSSANAVSVNIDFETLTPPVGAPSSGYGAAAKQGGHWNTIFKLGITENLLDLDGASTEIDLVLTGTDLTFAFSGGDTDTDIDKLLKDNFLTSGSGKDNWSLQISGLDEGKYDIYYYAPNQGNVETGTFSINGSSVASLPGVNTKPPTLEQGVSWDVLKDVSIGSLGLLMELPPPDKAEVKKLTQPDIFYGLAGLQIVQVSAGISPVPVPAAIWLFGTSLIGMVGFGRRRKAA